MKRALTLTLLAVLSIGLAAARAEASPTVGVLGIEPVDQSGSGIPTPKDTRVAKQLTVGLRARAKLPGRYQWAGPNSDKELVDEKLLKSCDSEAPSCMAAIGRSVHADMLMYGKIERKGRTYHVVIRLFDVRRKQSVKVYNDDIPVGSAKGPALEGLAKSIYAKLTGEHATGAIVLNVTGAHRGTILINEHERGSIVNGSGEVSGLAPGVYQVAVESQGFKRWDRRVTVRAGKTERVPVELQNQSAAGSKITGGFGNGNGNGTVNGHGNLSIGTTAPAHHNRHALLWKATFAGGLAVAAAGGLWLYHASTRVSAWEKLECQQGFTKNLSCNPADVGPYKGGQFDYSRGDKWTTQSYIGGAILAGGIVIAGFGLYYGFLHHQDGSPSEHAERGRRVHRPRFTITPVISPNGGGATVRLDW